MTLLDQSKYSKLGSEQILEDHRRHEELEDERAERSPPDTSSR
jgi:hypothetical protein